MVAFPAVATVTITGLTVVVITIVVFTLILIIIFALILIVVFAIVVFVFAIIAFFIVILILSSIHLFIRFHALTTTTRLCAGVWGDVERITVPQQCLRCIVGCNMAYPIPPEPHYHVPINKSFQSVPLSVSGLAMVFRIPLLDLPFPKTGMRCTPRMMCLGSRKPNAGESSFLGLMKPTRGSLFFAHPPS
ncbi:hypothetical protein CC2G_007812 [Coprinopsis cinerea AmutBmut pab1-1]|nr:hypothetical protein CC2G_007812 [Coprinopsis cinerea AmutBmut pab1-1]